MHVHTCVYVNVCVCGCARVCMLASVCVGGDSVLHMLGFQQFPCLSLPGSWVYWPMILCLDFLLYIAVLRKDQKSKFEVYRVLSIVKL